MEKQGLLVLHIQICEDFSGNLIRSVSLVSLVSLVSSILFISSLLVFKIESSYTCTFNKHIKNRKSEKMQADTYTPQEQDTINSMVQMAQERQQALQGLHQTSYGKDADFYRAAQTGNWHFIQQHIQQGKNTNIIGRNNSTAVMEACNDANPDCLRTLNLLISCGSDLDHQGMYNQTALHWCIARGDAVALSMLLTAGADTNIKCNVATPQGRLRLTPLEMLRGGHFSTNWWRKANRETEQMVKARCNIMHTLLSFRN